MNLCELTSLTLPLGSLNGARGSLRIKLHNRLYAPCSNLLSGSKCGIKDKVFYQYHKALEKTEAWPIEVHGYKKSIKELGKVTKERYPSRTYESWQAWSAYFPQKDDPAFRNGDVSGRGKIDEEQVGGSEQ